MPTPTPGTFTTGESIVQYAVSDGNFVPALVEGEDSGTPPVLALFVYVAGTPGYHIRGVAYDATGVAGTYKYDVTTSVVGDLEVGGDLSVDGDAAVTGDTALTGTLTVGGSSISGVNSGDVTLAAVGSAPSANGASLSGQALTLQPADATHPGVVTTGSQTFAGAKTFTGITAASGNYFQSTTGYAAAGVAPSAQGLLFFSGLTIVRASANTDSVVLGSGDGTVFGTFSATGLDLSTNANTQTERLKLPYTDSTASPGDAVINKASGRSAIASGHTTCVITNSVCTTTSVVLIAPEDTLNTVVWWTVLPGSGSFTVTVKVDPGATWKFRWAVFNGL